VDPSREHPHVPGPSLWPAGFAVGVIVALIGIVVANSLIVVGVVVALIFAGLWIRDAVRDNRELTHAPQVEPETRAARNVTPAPVTAPVDMLQPEERFPRNVFLELSTLGLGAVIGGLITLPVLGFMIGPAFLKQGVEDQDIGPTSNFPEGQFVSTTFTSNPSEGDVSRRTAFVRNNGMIQNLPSYTVISNHCAHLGCPVQPNGPPVGTPYVWQDVKMQKTDPSGFGCPCHGGQYDTEGNRIAGPPVRALDRYAFTIKNDHLYIGKPFSVAYVDGTGAQAQIHKVTYSFPGEHVDGWESWLYPIQPPH
jgi:quinol---cytochrome c reductase iron-sulfur subunit, bacillus type